MSDSDEIVVSKRRTNRLNLDSEEEARIEAQQQQRQEEIRLRKEEKRRKKEEQARLAEEQEQKRREQKRHFMDPNTMIEPDSNSLDNFQRAEKKIQKAYPDIRMPKEMSHKKRRIFSQSEEQDSDSEDSDSQDSESSSQSEEESEVVPKKKKIKKEVKKEVKRERKRQERAEQIRVAARHKAKQVKVEEKNPRDMLVNEVAVRWWYCLPPWPPANFNYELALKHSGYRLVNADQFRVEQNIVNGLIKATPIDGFEGIYKTKQKIIDVRPKETCPTLNFLRGKSTEELTSLLRQALREQIKSINSQPYKTKEDDEVEVKLTRRLNQIS